ncbi:MAG: hypothetical protein JXB35_15040 [Anaerolineae bacterium]|nr:hypothetical protein [Anaerolineae bacterium]
MTQTQLEIIHPDGTVSFVTLDPARGITNIGQAPENDLVLHGHGIAEFHAILDHRESKFRLTLLCESPLTVDGKQVAGLGTTTLGAWSTIEIDGHTLMVVSGASPAAPGRPSAAPAAPLPRETAVAPAAPDAAAPQPSAGPAPEIGAPEWRGTRPADTRDETLIADMEEREWTLDVEQSASMTVHVANGGPIVATLDVTLVGIPHEWVTITPPQLNLYEGQGGAVTITITPPRHYTSRAGEHHFAVMITSPNYPGRSSQLGATLTINPFHAFTVTELDPKDQTARGRRPRGTAKFHIANKGNGVDQFRLEALDPQRACTFEFEVPGEGGETLVLAQQAEMRLPPAETFVVPVHVSPTRRPFIALRKERHSYSVNVNLLAEDQIPRTLLGEVKVRPRIGPGLLILILLSLIALIVLIFRPRIYEFTASDTEIDVGQEIALTYRTSKFARRWIETDQNTRISLETPEDGYVDMPTSDTLYTLRVENLLSELVPFLSPSWDPILVDVMPLEPRIRAFTVDHNAIVAGQTIVLRWDVVNADGVVLSTNGQEQTLAPAEYVSERELTLGEPTNFTLRATNQYGGQAVASLSVRVDPPTPTPLPVPAIQRFTVAPQEVTAGENVTLTWEVEQATSVQILGQDYPPNGSTVQTLNEPGVVEFVLIALYDDESGVQSPSRRQSAAVRVTVREKPTPTPEPVQPEIADFRAIPEEVVMGSGATVQLVWSINGETTDVELFGPTIGTLNKLLNQGSLPITVDAATFFILTAYNGELSDSATVEIAVIEPTPTLPPPAPEPIIQFFEAEPVDDPDDVIEIEGSGLSRKYEVVYNAKVNFRWSVLNVEQVALAAGEDTSNRAPTGELATIIRAPVNYQLIATNAEGVTRYAFIEIVLRALSVPPAPQNLNGPGGSLAAGTPLTLTWTYNPNYVDNIIGFRIYRANTSDGIFNRLGDESQLPNTARSWLDPSPACGQVYYVSAVYLDLDNNKQETEPSPNRWYSWPCTTAAH